MINHIFNDTLEIIGDRVVQKEIPAKILLDKNEQPDDIENIIKQDVLNELFKASWNRYPNANNSEMEKLIAVYMGLNPENIAVAPGSANIITTLLNFFALNHKHIVIAQPSYTLFDYHCKTYGISYEPWYLNSSLEFDMDQIPELPVNSVLILASPNNPVGNTISASNLESLLLSNRDTLIIVDGVYLEYGNINYNQLIQKYNNLIILRSFSKAFPAAGLRLGYLCSNSSIVTVVKKLILLYSVNQFSQIFARVILNNPTYLSNIENRILQITNERDHMYLKLLELGKKETVIIKKSEGNFLLIKVPDPEKYNLALSQLQTDGIQILNTSNSIMLENTFRVSIGKHTENNAFIKCIKSIL